MPWRDTEFDKLLIAGRLLDLADSDATKACDAILTGVAARHLAGAFAFLDGRDPAQCHLASIDAIDQQGIPQSPPE